MIPRSNDPMNNFFWFLYDRHLGHERVKSGCGK